MPSPLTNVSHNQGRTVALSSKRSSIRNSKLSPYSRLPSGGSPTRKTQPTDCPPQHFTEGTASSMKSRTPTAASKLPRRAASPNSFPKDNTKGWVSTTAQRVSLSRANTDGHPPRGASEQSRLTEKTDSSNMTTATAGKTALVLSTDKPLPFPPIARITSNTSPVKLSRTLLDASEKPLKIAAGTPQEQDWPALYPEKASTPSTLRNFAEQHPIPQHSRPNQIRQKIREGPKPATNNPFTVRAKDRSLVNRLNNSSPTDKRVTRGKENQARTGCANPSKQPSNVVVAGRTRPTHFTPDASPTTSTAGQLTKSKVTNHGLVKIDAGTKPMARPSSPNGSERVHAGLKNPKLDHSESCRSSAKMRLLSPNTDVGSISPTRTIATNVNTPNLRLSSSHQKPSLSNSVSSASISALSQDSKTAVANCDVANVKVGRDQPLDTDIGNGGSSIPVLTHHPSPTKARRLDRAPSPARALSAASFTDVSSTGETRWPLLNLRSSKPGGKSTIHDYEPNTDINTGGVVTMRDDLKSHSGMSGTAPYILPRASSTPLRSATRTSPTSFSESDPVSRASMESGTSGARVKQADRVILGRSNGMPDLPSTHTHPYRQVVQNDSRQAIRQNGQPGKQASHQVAASRTGTPNGRKQPRKSPPANQAAKLRQASFEVIARQPTPGHDKHREATKNRPVASTQVQHKRRHQMSPKGSPPAEKGHKMKLKVRPSRSSSFASVGPAKANTSSTTSSKKSERKRSSESQSSEHSPSLAGYRTFRSETHKISLPSTGCRKNSAATQKNFTTPPPKKKNTTRNEQERTDPELTLSIGQRRALSKDQGSIRCPSRLQSESLHASKAEYSLHRSTFIPGICTSPDQLPERITDLRLSSDFKAAGAGHPKPRYSQATFSSKTYTDRGSTSKAKISLSIRNFFHKRNSKNALRSTGNTELAESISNINSDRSPAARNGRSSANFQQKSASNSGRTPTPAAVKKDASSPRDQGSPDQAMSSSPIPKSPASDISSETPSLVKYVREIASNLPSGTVERFRLLNITEIIMSTVENAKRAEIYAQEARANAVEAEHQSELAQLAVTQIRQMLGKGTSYGEGVKSLLRLSEARKAGRSKH